MTLRQQQSVFAKYVAMLIFEMDCSGYEVTFGEAYRSPEEAARLAKLKKGIRQSLHTHRLAIDLNLFKDGRYLSSTESHRPFGEWWERLHPACRWGGRFSRPDGNHYEMQWKGLA